MRSIQVTEVMMVLGPEVLLGQLNEGPQKVPIPANSVISRLQLGKGARSLRRMFLKELLFPCLNWVANAASKDGYTITDFQWLKDPDETLHLLTCSRTQTAFCSFWRV
jgi:hypothetical protein